MGEVLSPDICVIGAGTGGIAAALAAVRHGVPVVLVEKSEPGGAYLHAGGLASKAVGAVARRAQAFADAKSFGLNAPRPKVDFYRLHDHIREVAAHVAPNLSVERLNGLGVQVLRGAGQFTDRNTFAVGDTEIRARRFIVAAGSVPAIPPIPGLAEAPYLTGETIFDLLACPKHLAVIGATAAGLELAQAYRRLGAEVTVFDAGPPLAEYDPECAAIVLDQLDREGVGLRIGAPISRIKSARTKVQIFVAGDVEERIEATHLLVAAGRTPNIEGLGLAAAGIAHEPHGIVVDRHFKTSNKKVYAIGAAAGGRTAANAARKQAEIVIAHALLRIPIRFDESAIPRAVFTQPELAQVGRMESDARQGGRGFRVLRWPYRENDRARVEGQDAGHVKIITTKGGKVLGAAIVGAQASELIAAWALAVGNGLHIGALAGLAPPSPTFAEIGTHAAASYAAFGLARPWFRRIIAAMRLLG